MISREAFAAYDAALVRNADMAVEELGTAWRSMLLGLSGRELAAALLDIMPALVAKYGERAAAVAVEFYREQRDASDVDAAYEARAYSEADPEYVRAETQEAIDSSTASGLRGKLGGLLVRQVNAKADETIIRNAVADPAHPRWALVPHAGACGWCVLLASQGFWYSARGRVPRHDHCKCAVAVDFSDDPALEGYDVGPMRGAYADARRTVEADARRSWGSMSAEERSKYQRNGKTSYDAYLRNRIAAEMSARDRGWLQRGGVLDYSLAEGAEPDQTERSVGGILGGHGMRVVFQPRSLTLGDRRADTVINGSKWEIKSPRGKGYLTILNQFKSVVFGENKHVRNPQASRVVISNVRSALSLEEMAEGVRRAFESNEYPEVVEVLLVSKDEGLMRLKK